MSAPTDVYVDMDIGGTSGSGTSGDPYSELQHAMDSTSLGAGGTRFLVKGSQSVSSALSLTTHGAPGLTQPVIIENWSGSPAISGGGTTSILTTNYDCIYWIGPLKLHTTGSNDIINMYRYSFAQEIEFENSTGDAVSFSEQYNTIVNCQFTDIGAMGINGNGKENNLIDSCYFKQGATNDFTACVGSLYGSTIQRCIMSIDAASKGVDAETDSNFSTRILNNSILSVSGTGAGVFVGGGAVDALNMRIASNLIEGFSGTGGSGIDGNSPTRKGLYINNACYNNATNYRDMGDFLDGGDNEALGSSPFDKSGSDTYANRATYFGPVDTGNVRGGAYPTALRLDKGAVQHADPAGGGGTPYIIGG